MSAWAGARGRCACAALALTLTRFGGAKKTGRENADVSHALEQGRGLRAGLPSVRVLRLRFLLGSACAFSLLDVMMALAAQAD